MYEAVEIDIGGTFTEKAAEKLAQILYDNNMIDMPLIAELTNYIENDYLHFVCDEVKSGDLGFEHLLITMGIPFNVKAVDPENGGGTITYYRPPLPSKTVSINDSSEVLINLNLIKNIKSMNELKSLIESFYPPKLAKVSIPLKINKPIEFEIGKSYDWDDLAYNRKFGGSIVESESGSVILDLNDTITVFRKEETSKPRYSCIWKDS